ncbi:Uncharacterized protein PBTT_04285 [Plasmodiophora brassicae]|uniref:Uncharacterized protein n=1 Tax=Plasmodiophora brassicae TaxID=37360 RepID=A0A0G4IH01_PLABS|nr:hypothetical protein PBRA_000137 [Plasmodiophora brassicae]SPQ96704.1 unnamed protein product [Plasmodiophora brassicae]
MCGETMKRSLEAMTSARPQQKESNRDADDADDVRRQPVAEPTIAKKRNQVPATKMAPLATEYLHEPLRMMSMQPQMTIDTCVMLSESERRQIISECYEVNPLVDQLDKIPALAPLFAASLTPGELQMCDRLLKMCMARQIQLYRYIRTFGARFDQAAQTASPDSLNGLVQYLVRQVSRLLQDDIAAVNACRTKWINRRFAEMQVAARMARASSPAPPQSTPLATQSSEHVRGADSK